MKPRRSFSGRMFVFTTLMLVTGLTGCVVDLKVAVSEGTQNFIFSLLDPARYLDTLDGE